LTSCIIRLISTHSFLVDPMPLTLNIFQSMLKRKKVSSQKEVSLKFHLDNIPWCVTACTPCTNTQTFFKWC
jgi:hypothetical protein